MMMLGGILTLGAVALFLIFYNGVIVGESVVVALDNLLVEGLTKRFGVNANLTISLH